MIGIALTQMCILLWVHIIIFSVMYNYRFRQAGSNWNPIRKKYDNV